MLAAGIQQLQQAQLNMMNQKVGQPEQVKPGIAALPALDPPGAEDSPVVIQDWMELIDGPMRDLSDGSGAWWEAVKSEVSLHYAKWVASTPYQRLAMQGPMEWIWMTGGTLVSMPELLECCWQHWHRKSGGTWWRGSVLAVR